MVTVDLGDVLMANICIEFHYFSGRYDCIEARAFAKLDKLGTSGYDSEVVIADSHYIDD